MVMDLVFIMESTLSLRIFPSGQVGINRDGTPLNGVKLMVQNDNNVFYAYHEGTGNNYTIFVEMIEQLVQLKQLK